MDDIDNDIAAFAHQYANDGLAVLPIFEIKNGNCSCDKKDHCKSAGKHPRTRNGVKDASTSHDQIDEWWKKYPDANIGIATGKVSNIVVIDVDPRHGGDESLTQLQLNNGKLPETLTVNTGGGGSHLYFKYPECKGHIKNRAGKIASGIDTRADGGFVVAPPSNHLSSSQYTFQNADTPIFDLPDWLLSMIIDHATPAGSVDFETIEEGSRNISLTSIAGMARASGMSNPKLKTFLLEENVRLCTPPLDHSEVIRIVDSVTRYKQGVKRYIFTWREQIIKSDLPAGMKHVLCVLSFSMNNCGRSCYPTTSQLAAYTSMSRKTVGKHLAAAEKMGLIQRYKHTGNENGYWNYGYIATDPTNELNTDG